MKKATILILSTTMVCILILCSCSSNSSELKGTWVNPTNSNTATIELGESTFDSGGINFPGATLDSGANGTYEFKNNTLIVAFSNGITEEYPMEKVNGIWELHANTLDPYMIWVKDSDLEAYLNETTNDSSSSSKEGITLPFDLSWGDDGTTVINKIKKVSESSDDEYTGAIIKATGASLFGYKSDLEIKAGDSGLSQIRIRIPSDQSIVDGLVETMSAEFGFSPEFESGTLIDKYTWKYEDTKVILSIPTDCIQIDYVNE